MASVVFAGEAEIERKSVNAGDGGGGKSGGGGWCR